MPKMIVSIDGVVIKEVQLTKDRTTLGRRPYNDVVIDNLAISGEHAVFQMTGNDVFIEDLNSTNGTYVNGKIIKKHALQHGDVITVGHHALRFVESESNEPQDEFEKTMVISPRDAAALMAGLLWIVNRTRLGLAMRATSQNIAVAGLMGVDANRIIVAAFAIGAVLASASAREGSPRSMMEAMAVGLAVVATDVGAVSDLVIDGVEFKVLSGDDRRIERALELLGELFFR